MDNELIKQIENFLQLLPQPIKKVVYDPEVLKKLDELPRENLNEFGFDPFGYNPDILRKILPFVLFLYRVYFRVEVHDIDRVPLKNVVLVANHAGQLPFDGFVVAASMFIDAPKPRIVRSMVERWVPTLPFISWFMARTGQVVGDPDNFVRLLKRGETILDFPEGVRGIAKTFKDRYRLAEFGQGFMRLALATNATIVPVGVVGSEETIISLHNSKTLARLFGAPSFPITPFFPWLGPLGLLPLPVKIRLYYGKPIKFKGDPDEDDEKIMLKVKKVRSALRSLIQRGLNERKHIFW